NDDVNTQFRQLDLSYTNFDNFSKLFDKWYQRLGGRNLQYHFMTAIRTESLHKIGGFDIDFAFGVAYDDDELIFKIRRNRVGIKIFNIPHEYGLMGVHQWHPSSESTWGYNKILNNKLFEAKVRFYDANNQFYYL